MKEKPIIFSADMVKTILDGKKTMTRHLVKFKDFTTDGITPLHIELVEGRYCLFNERNGWLIGYPKCPYGKIGDRLWVREAYTVTGWNHDDGSVYIKYLADGREQYFDNETDEMECAIDSLVNSVCKELDKRKVPMLNDEAYDCSLDENKPRNRSPMSMPRFASRILLEITEIRIERLQDISEQDCEKEGFRFLPATRICFQPNNNNGSNNYKSIFGKYWDTLNTKKGYQWASNPWVWVIEFKKVHNDKPSD